RAGAPRQRLDRDQPRRRAPAVRPRNPATVRRSPAPALMNYRLVLLLLLCALGCGYRPPRFADRPPVGEVHDDRPISVPEPRRILRDLFVADVYVRRELVKSLDPRRSRWALDISSMDEVPRS